MEVKSINKEEKNLVELEIQCGEEEFGKACERAYKKNIVKMNVPGYRKGKAPRKLVERLYGEGVFFEEAVNSLYPGLLAQAVEKENLEPVSRPEIEITDVSKEGFTFKAKITVKPEVEEIEYKGLKASKAEIKIGDEDVKSELEALRQRGARLISADDREIADGDTAVIDFEGFIDGVPFEGGKGENHNLKLGSGQFIPGFEEQLIGCKAGQELDVNVSFPEEYHAEELKGKPAVFKVKINDVKYTELPVLDDEFAKDVSEFDTLDELKADLKAKLQEKKDGQADSELETMLLDGVLAHFEAEIPAVMIQSRVNELVKDFEYRLQSQGLNLQTYLGYTGMAQEDFQQSMVPQAERQVKIRLALEQVAKLESLTATAEEIDAEYAKLAENYGIEADKIKTFVSEKEIVGDVAFQKAMELVKAQAAITEKTEEEAEKEKAVLEAAAKAAEQAESVGKEEETAE